VNDKPLFEAAYPFQNDVLALPVTDLNQAAEWYGKSFGLTEAERRHLLRRLALAATPALEALQDFVADSKALAAMLAEPFDD